MSSESFGVPTPLDWAHAWAFANDQVNKLKCEDPEVIKTVCKEGNPNCLTWQQDESERIYPVPNNITNIPCTKDSDCKHGNLCLPDPNNPSKLVCAYYLDKPASGHCRINNAKTCLDISKLPYTCTNKTCTWRDEKELNGSYVEWHENKDDPLGGQCVLGNFILKQWAENPQSRCTYNDKTNSYPAQCTGEETIGITEPETALFYDSNKSAVYMTHDYCNRFGMSYNKKHLKCTDNSQCTEPDNYCVVTKQGGYCTGPDADCYTTSGDKVGQFFVGRTLFYLFKKNIPPWKWAKCGEGFEIREKDFDGMVKDISEGLAKEFNNTSMEATGLGDSRYMKEKKLVTKDFAGKGINLYLITWKPEIQNGRTISGFDADEVKKVYPHLVIEKDGKKIIAIHRKEITDNNIKRMYLTLNTKKWVTENIFTSIMQEMKLKKKG